MKTLLETSTYFTYVKTEVVSGIEFEVYLDDYGMSYVLAWRDPRNNTICEWGCGMCNDYHIEMLDIANYLVKNLTKESGNSKEKTLDEN